MTNKINMEALRIVGELEKTAMDEIFDAGFSEEEGYSPISDLNDAMDEVDDYSFSSPEPVVLLPNGRLEAKLSKDGNAIDLNRIAGFSRQSVSLEPVVHGPKADPITPVDAYAVLKFENSSTRVYLCESGRVMTYGVVDEIPLDLN